MSRTDEQGDMGLETANDLPLYTSAKVPFVPANHRGWRKGEIITQPRDQNRNPKSELAVLET